MKVVSKLLADSLWAFVFQIAPRFASALLFILVSRLAGPAQAGSFSLAATYLVTVTTLMRGLDELIIRQVVRSPKQSGQTLVSFLALRLGLSVVFYGGTLALVWGWLEYSPTTAQIISILTLSAIPDSLAYVAQAVMLGHGQFSSPGWVAIGINVFKLLAGAWVLTHNGTAILVAWIWLGGSTLGMVLLIGIAFRQVEGWRGRQLLNWRLLLTNARSAMSFVGIAVLLTLDTQVDNIILSAFHPETEVAWYYAATTLLSGFLMLSQAYRFSIYPLMTRYAAQAPEKLANLYEHSIRYIGVGVIPLSVTLILSASLVVERVYGPDFQPVVQIWRILSVVLVFLYLNEPNSRMLLVHDKQGQIVFFLSASAITNLALNLLLTPQWGALGTAYARLGSSGLLFLLCAFYVNRRLPTKDTLSITTRLVVLCCVLMGLYHFFGTSFSIYVSYPLFILMYSLSLVAFGIVRTRDFNTLKELFGIYMRHNAKKDY